MEHSIERSGEDRRKNGGECDNHRDLAEKLQAAQSTVDKNSGRWAAMLWFLGVIGSVLSIGMVTLITKTSDIQTLLSKNDVVLMQHTERIESLRKEVDGIRSRNQYIDQQGALKTFQDKP